MFFTFQRKQELLEIDDDFANLININEATGDVDFEFNYSVKQLDVIRSNALTVKVSVISGVIKPKPLVGDTSPASVDADSLVLNILNQIQNAKQVVKEQGNNIVASRVSDITAKINNEIIPQLRAGVDPREIQGLKKVSMSSVPIAELKQQNAAKPLLQIVAHPSIDVEVDPTVEAAPTIDSKSVMFDMITRYGVDPSYITTMTHRSISSWNALQGLIRKSRSPERLSDPQVRLLHYHLFRNNMNPLKKTTDEADDTTIVNVSDVAVQDALDLTVKLTIPEAKRLIQNEPLTHFLIKFELIDGKTQATVDQVIKPLDMSKYVQLYYTPRTPPIVNVSDSTSPSVNIEIKQTDSAAREVHVYRKNIYRSSVTTDDYQLVDSVELTSPEQVYVSKVPRQPNSTSIYRVISVGKQGTVGYDYTNVVVTPINYRPINAVSLTAKNTDVGIDVEVSRIPTNVVTIQVMKRNVSTHDSGYLNVGTPVLITNEIRNADHVLVSDTSVSKNRIYEYALKLYHNSGISEIIGGVVIEHNRVQPGKIDLVLSDLNVSHDDEGPNVTFTMNSTILDSDLDIIKKLLEAQGIDKYFEGDVEREREFLSGLIAHHVQRVNLTTGDVETFGVVVNEVFNDKDLRKNTAVSTLKYGHKYRYDVTTLIRRPETMFEQYVKSKVDPVTNKTYEFLPSKFLHPVVLSEGMIVTSSGLKTLFAKDAMTHGAQGAVASLDVSFDVDQARIVKQAAARFNTALNIIEWKVDGIVENIDHFLIMKDVHGVRTVIGKAHSEFEFGNCQYLHSITEQDRGELKYIIVPIFNDYSVGSFVTTNSVIV